MGSCSDVLRRKGSKATSPPLLFASLEEAVLTDTVLSAAAVEAADPEQLRQEATECRCAAVAQGHTGASKTCQVSYGVVAHGSSLGSQSTIGCLLHREMNVRSLLHMTGSY